MKHVDYAGHGLQGIQFYNLNGVMHGGLAQTDPKKTSYKNNIDLKFKNLGDKVTVINKIEQDNLRWLVNDEHLAILTEPNLGTVLYPMITIHKYGTSIKILVTCSNP